MEETASQDASAFEHEMQQAFLVRHPGAATAALEELDRDALVEIVVSQPVETMLGVWARLSPPIGSKLLNSLPEDVRNETLLHLNSVQLARLLAAVTEEERETTLSLLERRKARAVRGLLVYPPDRAGALMDAGVRTLRETSTVGRGVGTAPPGAAGRHHIGFFVVDTDNRLVGWVDMQDLALAEPREVVGDLARRVRAVVDTMATQDEVGENMETHHLWELAVVDLDGKLMGVIRHTSMIEAERERATTGIQTMVGASKDERALSKVSFAVFKRLPWLQANLITAFAAAAVVGLFESTIAQYTALAVLLPVVAGQSGNTGAQALAVTMRGLALREIRTMHWPRVVFKETNVGFWNGTAVALTHGRRRLRLERLIRASDHRGGVDDPVDGHRRHRRRRDPDAADGAAAGPGAILLHHPHHGDRRDGLLQLPRHRDPPEQHDLTCAGQHAGAFMPCTPPLTGVIPLPRVGRPRRVLADGEGAAERGVPPSDYSEAVEESGRRIGRPDLKEQRRERILSYRNTCSH